MHVAAKTVPRVQQTALLTPLPCSDVRTRKEQVTVPTRNTSYSSATVGLLTLLERRAADTRDTPHGTACDVGPLQPPLHVPVLVTAS